ncbi:CHAT domain-containing protein [Nonomuraea wenchangensis]|uniref:CHAT domain-containing protein n=1 Tax=Nonomuraea wenchangensis TaxID=568860 RepID=A0A1I0LRX6_9ACTN|nr:CHAT domain-containing tetratricopeptide repeat protein [Nonomuraea wenchangensis]SEU44173.1 CHAT domain-containing protein [Nonomuraea wenchangensis]
MAGDGASQAISRGDALLEQGDLDGAEAAYHRALAADPGSAEALYSLGCVASHRGDHAAGLDWARRAIALDPAHRGARALAGNALLGLERHAEALEHLQAVHEDPPGGVHVQMALCHEGMGDLERAELELRAVLERDVTYRTRHLPIAMYDQSPFWADLHAHLARVLRRRGADEEARLHYHLAKRIDPTVELDPGYLEVMRREDLEDHPIDRHREQHWLDELDLSGLGELAEPVRRLLGLAHSADAGELTAAVAALGESERTDLVDPVVALIRARQEAGDFLLSARLRAVGDLLVGEDGSELFTAVISSGWRRLLEAAERLHGQEWDEEQALAAAAADAPVGAPDLLLALVRRFVAVDPVTGLPLARVVAAALGAYELTPDALAALLTTAEAWRDSGDLIAAERTAVIVAEEAEPGETLLSALDLLSRVQHERGHEHRAVATLQRYVEEADRSGDLDRRVRGRYNLAVSLSATGQRELAREVAAEGAAMAAPGWAEADFDRLLAWIAGTPAGVGDASEALWDSAMALVDEGRNDEARETLTELLQSLPAHRVRERAAVRLQLARLHDRHEPAEADLRLALAEAIRVDDPQLELAVRQSLSELLLDVDPDAAVHHHGRVVRLRTQLAGEPSPAGSALREAADPEAALARMIAELETMSSPGVRRRAAVTAGTAAVDLNRPELAEAPLRLAIELASGGDWADADDELAARIALGTACRWTGRYDEAIVQYEAALRVAERFGEELQIADISGRLGIALRYADRLDEAVAAYERAGDLLRRYDRAPGLAMNQMNLASALFLLGRRAQAMAMAADALGEFELLGEREWALRTLTLLATHISSADELPPRIAQALREGAAQSSDPLLLGWSWSDRARRLLDEGDIAGVEHAMGQAIEVHRGRDRYNEAMALLNRASLLGPHLPEVALADARAALEIARSLGQETLAADAESELLRLALARRDASSVEKHLGSLTTRWTRLRRSLRSDRDRVSLAAEAAGLTKAAAAYYLDEQEFSRAAQALDQSRALALGDLLATRLADDVPPSRARALLGELPVPTLAVSLDHLGDRLVLGLLRAGDPAPRFVDSPLGPAEVTRLLADFDQELVEYGGHGAQTWPPRLRQLLRPALEELASGEQVLFMAEGDLQRLPLHAVLEGAPAFYAPSFTTLALARARPPHASAVPLVTVGVAFPDEARAVALTFEGGRCVSGRHLSKEDVRESVAAAAIVHFACHGYFDTQNFTDSGLLLRVTQDPVREEILSLRDLADWRLHADLVVLSACETGLGQVVPSDFLGLSRGMLAAGARAVLATLWPVDDTRTQAIILDLYRQMERQRRERGRVDVAAALATAQARARESLPLYDWAGFKLIGWPLLDLAKEGAP